MLTRVRAYALGLCVGAGLSGLPAEAVTVKSAKGYQFDAPAGWRVDHTGMMGTDVVVFAKPDRRFAANINVLVAPVTPGVTMSAIEAHGDEAAARLLTGYKGSPMRHVRISGEPALEHTGTFRQGTLGMAKMLQRLAIHEGRQYVFTCTALTVNYARYEPAFKKAMASIRWTK